MYVDLIVWDDEDDPDGNLCHIAAAGLSPGEVDHAILSSPRSHDDPDGYSASSGRPLIFGDAPDGRRIAVIYDDESDAGLVIVKPRTAYPVRRKGE